MVGRKAGSQVRRRVAAILNALGKSYGYEIYKNYINIFGKVDIRLIYYHLKSGVNRKEFIVSEIKKEKGGYTWGDLAERVYYDIGPMADPLPFTDEELKSVNKLKTQVRR